MEETRLTPVMDHLTTDTVFGDLLKPVIDVLDRVRYKPAIFREVKMPTFIALGVLRHLQGVKSLREQVQLLLHLSPEDVSRPPLARSSWSDAIHSPRRQAVLRDVVPELVQKARSVLPDRLLAIPGLGSRSVYAVDGTYQEESVHYRRCTPRQGGHDNPKGHGLLTFYDARLGVPVDVYVETRSDHEIAVLREYDRGPGALTQEKKALWLVDRGFLSARDWDAKKRKLKSTVITRMKSNLVVEDAAPIEVPSIPENRDVVRDEKILLRSSSDPWRRVTFCNDAGDEVVFLTNEMTLEPGVIAFLFLRRWDEEKCFDVWKNDFSQAKAWSKFRIGIENQARLAIITSLLVAMLLQEKAGLWNMGDEKALRKQERRHQESAHRDGEPMWFTLVYHSTSKVSRQVLRFFKHCFLKRASQTLYECQLKPLLERYI